MTPSKTANISEDYPNWFLTLNQCTDEERTDSSRDDPNKDVIDSFQLDDFPTRTSFFMYPYAADTAEMCDQIEETLEQVTVEDKNDEQFWPVDKNGSSEKVVKSLEEEVDQSASPGLHNLLQTTVLELTVLHLIVISCFLLCCFWIWYKR